MDRDYKKEFPLRNVPLIVFAACSVGLFAVFVVFCFSMWLLFGLAGLSLAMFIGAFIAAPTGFVVMAAFFSKAPSATGNLAVFGLFMLVAFSIASVKIQEVRESARRVSCMNSLREVALQSQLVDHPFPMQEFDWQMISDQNDQYDLVDGPRFQGDFTPIPDYVFASLGSSRSVTSASMGELFVLPEFNQGLQEPVEIEASEQPYSIYSLD